jgi:hypothetical protein
MKPLFALSFLSASETPRYPSQEPKEPPRHPGSNDRQEQGGEEEEKEIQPDLLQMQVEPEALDDLNAACRVTTGHFPRTTIEIAIAQRRC